MARKKTNPRKLSGNLASASYAARQAAERYVSERVDTIAGDLEKAKKLLDVIPPANFTPAVQGRWIESDHGSYICSLCYEDWMLNDGTPEENHMNYCPRCGARMGDALDGR